MRARVLKILIPGLVLLVVYVVIYATGMPQWKGRILIMALLLPSVNVWILWYGINPKTGDDEPRSAVRQESPKA